MNVVNICNCPISEKAHTHTRAHAFGQFLFPSDSKNLLIVQSNHFFSMYQKQRKCLQNNSHDNKNGCNKKINIFAQ